MILSVMQPTYLPWPGYFNLISRADKFVFLDDVKVEKSSWHVRNKLAVNGKDSYISVTVDSSRTDNIDQVQLSTKHPWRKKHIGMLQGAYNKHPYGKEVIQIVAPVIQDDSLITLADLNIRLIAVICDYLGLARNFVRSSELEIAGVRSDRLLSLCQHFNADTYLSPLGAKEYIEADGILVDSAHRVEYQNFPSEEYSQKGVESFIPYLSIVDLLSNLGAEKGLAYVRGQHRV